jgi:hypothetical protein
VIFMLSRDGIVIGVAMCVSVEPVRASAVSLTCEVLPAVAPVIVCVEPVLRSVRSSAPSLARYS